MERVTRPYQRENLTAHYTYPFNLDPFSTSKSSKTEVCPIFMKVNELPPNQRQKNVILAGLWLGPKALDSNLFMTGFRKQCNRLSERSISRRPEADGVERVSTRAEILQVMRKHG